jgi:hypothetical protein
LIVVTGVVDYDVPNYQDGLGLAGRMVVERRMLLYNLIYLVQFGDSYLEYVAVAHYYCSMRKRMKMYYRQQQWCHQLVRRVEVVVGYHFDAHDVLGDHLPSYDQVVGRSL